MNAKILDKNDIDIVVYDENATQFGGAYIVWYYYRSNWGNEKTDKIQFISNDDIITTVHKLSLKNVILIGEVDCVSKIYDVTNTFMQTKNIEQCWNYFFPDIVMPCLFNYMNDVNFMTIFLEKMYDFEEWETYFNVEFINECIVRGKVLLSTKQLMIRKSIADVMHIIQDVGGIYMYVLYCESEYFKSEICAQLCAKYPICDIFVVYYHDVEKNTTTYCIKSLENAKIIKNHVGMIFYGSFWMKLDGKCNLLPYRTINDLGLLKKMRNGIHGIVIIKKQKYSYVLMDVVEINEEWIENDFATFIKRKNEGSSLIVFEKPSDDIEYDKINHTMIALKDYVIVYNGQTSGHALKNLEFNLCNNEYLLCITSEKEFADIFPN
jgi:hypothetical protein